MYNLNWSRDDLSPQKLGTFGEYYAKMTLASYGVDIYTSEVDDHGIDFVAETARGFLKFQVKTIRSRTTNYVFMRKDTFDISDPTLYLLLIMLTDGQHPELYLIPSASWSDPAKTALVYHAYDGKKSTSEYGVNLSKKNLPQLECFKLEHCVDMLRPHR